MKILVMSDSHGRDNNILRAIKAEQPLDAIIHLGDFQEDPEQFRLFAKGICPMYLCDGNCDFYPGIPSEQILELGGHRLLITHGHYYYVNFGVGDLLADAKANGCDVALYGHTHRPDEDVSDPECMVLNPGSISFPRQESREPSYLVLYLEPGKKPVADFRFL